MKTFILNIHPEIKHFINNANIHGNDIDICKVYKYLILLAVLANKGDSYNGDRVFNMLYKELYNIEEDFIILRTVIYRYIGYVHLELDYCGVFKDYDINALILHLHTGLPNLCCTGDVVIYRVYNTLPLKV